MASTALEIILRARDDASKTIKAASDTMNKSFASTERSIRELQPAFQRMSLIGAAAFTGIAAGIGATLKEATSLGESVNAVNVVFESGAERILSFGKTAATSVGLANSEFNQMATLTGALLKGTGKPISEVADMTVRLTERAADLASVFNTDVSDAMSAINQALRGETEAIRRYAGDVTDATLQTYALSQGITTSVSEMTEQEKRLLRVGLIMEQTKDTAGDFANTSGELANQQRILSAQFQDIATTVGAAFVPVMKDMLATVRPLITQVAAWVQQNPELTRNIVIAAAAVTGLVAVVGALGLVLPPIITGFTLLASPVGLVIVAIGSLIAGLVWAENRFGILSRAVEFARGMFAQLAHGISGAVSWIGERIEWFRNNWAQAIGFVIGYFATLPIRLPVLMIQAIMSIIGYLATVNWGSVFSSIGRAFEGAMQWVKNAAQGAWNYVRNINWGAVLGGISRGIGNGIIGLIEGAINGAVSGIPGFRGIRLPRFEKGTNFAPGGLAIVGERGPELVNLPRGSQVIPNDKIGGAGGTTINIAAINNYHPSDFDAQARTLGWELSRRLA